MCGGSKGATTTSQSPTPQAMGNYSALMQRIGKTSLTPYQQYGGELVAGVNPEQTAGIGNINQNWNYALPYNQQAIQMATAAAQPITGSQIQQYMDPFTQQVIDATQNQFNNQNVQQLQGVRGNAIAQGALGGSREAVAESELANQQQLAQAPVIAGLRSQGYQTGLNTALTEQQAQAQGAYGLGNLGMSGEQAALQGAGAQIGAGGLQQQTQQALDQALLQQFMQKQAYPYQQLSWAAGLDTGLGSQMGGTSTTTPPPPSLVSQMMGLGTLGAGMFGSQGAVAGLGGLGSSMMSGLGSLGSGLLQGGTTALGYLPLAALASRGGAIKHHGVVPHYDDGGGVPPDGSMGVGGMPWAGAHGWIPGAGITHGKGPPAPPSPGQPQDIAGQAKQIGALADMMRGKPQPPAQGVVPGSAVPADYNPNSLSGLYYRGGHVRHGWMPHGIAVPHYDEGGGVDTFADRFNAASDFDTPVEPPRGVVFHDEDFNIGGPAAQRAALLNAYMEKNKGDPAIYGGEPDGVVPSPRQRVPIVPRENYEDMHGGRALAFRGEVPEGLSGYEGVPAGITTGDFLPAAYRGVSGPSYRPSRGAIGPAPEPEHQGIDWSSNSKLWPALMAAGLGMMASRSPYAGVGIGEGGLMGMQAYTHASEQEQAQNFNKEKLQQEAEKLHQQAELEQKKLEQAQLLHTTMTPYQKALLEQGKTPPGMRLVDGKLEEIPGYFDNLKRIEESKSLGKFGPGMSPEAKEVMARRMIEGDLSGYNSLGRTGQGIAVRNELNNMATEIVMRERGLTATDAAKYLNDQKQAYGARQIGLNTEARTAGQRETNLSLILRATDAAIPAALEASDKVERYGGRWVPINQIVQRGEVITSNPELAEFGMANLQLAEHWARAMNPTGVMRESDRDKALGFLNTATSKETYKRMVLQLQKQITRERDSIHGVNPNTPINPNAPTPAPGDVSGTTAAPATAAGPPEGAIQMLRKNPALRDQFDAKYGAGSAAKVLGRDSDRS